MKKILLLFVFVLAATFANAQNWEMYSLISHNMGGYGFGIEDVMQQRNGDILVNCPIGVDSGTAWGPIYTGTVFYKIKPSLLAIIDSLFIENPDTSIYAIEAPKYFFAPNPQGEDNIQVVFEYHEDSDSSFLCICHFPDHDLNINHNDDIVVPVCEGHAYGSSTIVDYGGDLVMTYYKEPFPHIESDIYIARISPDGILKHQASLSNNGLEYRPNLNLLRESPLKYYQWYGDENYPSNLVVSVMDSLFHQNIMIINTTLNQEVIDPNMPYVTVNEYLSLNGDTEVIPAGDDDILVAAQYVYDTTGHPMTAEYGVAVAKYDIRTMQLKGYIVCNDYLGYYKRADCLGLKKMTDGTVYFLYKEEGYPQASFMAVKMDTNLNVEWKRFCKTDNVDLYSPLNCPILYKDEQGEEKGIVWAGNGRTTGNSNYNDFVFFLLNHDGPVGMENYGIEVRPYAFYPNPAKERLHFEYSPDVQPAKVELYDLQGRLMRTQRSNFEDIDVGQLPAGTYTLRVTLEDGKAYSDKVVKE